ncbi:MAG: hypothetical protein KDE27_24755 [Planctomycetes bacterium]|nr:hypothetical protein [Planctomycetota bacterium]
MNQSRIVAAASALFAGSLANDLAAQWRDIATTNSPQALYSPAMACSDAGTILLFGGSRGSSTGPNSTTTLYATGTWVRDGGDWLQLMPSTVPQRRLGAQCVYDPVRGRFVMYGGWMASGLLGTASAETFEFDGVDWQQVTPASGPGPRYQYGMSHDLARQRTVLFGGRPQVLGSQLFDDTWEYDGVNWQQVSTPNRPPRLERQAMAYLPAIGATVMFGGIALNAAGNQLALTDATWSYDGSDWTLITPPGPRPVARVGSRMVLDSARNVLVLHGGMATGGTVLADTWEFDGATWTLQPTQTTARVDAGLAFDPVRREVVRFGGRPSTSTVAAGTTAYGAHAQTVGIGCQGTNGAPSLDSSDAPRLGLTFDLQLQNLDPGAAFAVLVLGASATAPTPLGGFGMPGCIGYVSADLSLLVAANAGAATWTSAIPNQLALLGAGLFAQGFSFDAAANALGLVSTNGWSSLVGH